MKSVLLIEPDKVLARTYKEALEEGDFKVEVVGGAQAAINSADHAQPDIVVVELQLAGHSGFEFLYEFRSYQEWQNIPVLILSAVPSQEFADNWALIQRELGVVDYLYKPTTSLKKLIDKLSDQLKEPAK
ncbi:MAG TPA: response regulator [Candidatus Saccharimonadales bacterium]